MPFLRLAYAPNANLDTIQSATVSKFVNLKDKRAIAFHKVGTGKTRIAIGFIAALRQREICGSVLIVIRPKALYDWKVECFLCRLKFKEITFISYASLHTLPKDRTYETVIIDELFLFTNVKSRRSKNLERLSARADSVLGLTGTILPKDDNTAVWGYFSVLAASRHLSRNLTAFRSEFQTGFDAVFAGREVKLFKPKANWKTLFLNKVANRVSFYYPKDYVRTTYRAVECALSREQKSLLKTLTDLYVLRVGDEEVFCKTARQVYHYARGITNGWVQSSDGSLLLLECEKRDALLEKLDELHDSTEQSLIWCAYKNDIKALRLCFKHPSLTLVGGSEFDLPAWQSGKHLFTFATMGSGHSVNHFKEVGFGLYFSLSKRLDWQQSTGRIGRRGSTHCANHIRYHSSGSVDDDVWTSISETEESEKSLIRKFQQRYNIQLPLT